MLKRVRRALAVGLLIGTALPVSASASPSSPAAVVNQYLTALNHHNGAAVCATFSARLRAFEIAHDAPISGRRTCAGTVNAHFHDYYSAHRWASARIAGSVGTLINNARGIALVRTTLAHRYICVGKGTVDQPCRPDVVRRPEYIWLIRAGDHWAVLKPGLVYRASEIESASDDESIYYPPGDATTIAAPVRIPAPTFRCPASRATVADKAGDVENLAGLHPFWVRAPWLDMRRLSVSRVDGHTLCITLVLGAAPRADSTYGFDIVHELGGGVEEGTNFGLTIDGVGVLHPQLGDTGALTTPSISRSLPRAGLAGNRLEFAVSEPRHFTSGLALSVDAAAGSVQRDEPLLTHPLDAGDLTAPDRGCLKFPTGGITLAGICGNEPGP